MIANATQSTRPRKERKDNADRRRLQLIEATLRSIVDNGLARTTLATVAQEAGLSQGVALFYFQSKDKLLAEALAHHYGVYEDAWRAELDKATDNPADRMAALIRADFSPGVCNHEALAIWFSFWGEAKFRPRYAETSRRFDESRGVEIVRACAELMPGYSDQAVRETAICIESMTDGFWQKLYLSPDLFDREEALAVTMRYLRMEFPEHAEWFV